MSKNNYQEALEICKKGIGLFPHSKDLQCFLGDIYIQFNQLEKALNSYSTALNCGNGQSDANLFYKHGHLLYQVAENMSSGNEESKIQASYEYKRAMVSLTELSH